MSKVSTARQQAPTAARGPVVTPQQPTMVSPLQAMQLLATRIHALEAKLALHLGEIERKLGDHAAYVTDNIPDLDTLNSAIAEINSRVLDLEELEPRVAALEAAGGEVAPASPPPLPPAKAAKKKGGTVKLVE